jgi:CheY-like chemotaxis protein
MTRDRMRLDDVRTLVVDGDHQGVTIHLNMLYGLGINSVKVAETASEAQEHLGSGSRCDLCICDASLPDMAGTELVKWIRQCEEPARFMPTLVLTGYAGFRNVVEFRDAGAHLVVRKPASPQMLYDRIAWLSTPHRAFIESENYVGPDRRFKSEGPPDGIGRRATDLSAEIGDAVDPNMSQDEIDNLIRPMKVFAE